MVDLWPENEPGIDLFTRYSTQWRTSMGGVVGLDYSVLQHDLAMRGITGERYDELMAAIRVIEGAAMKQLNGKA